MQSKESEELEKVFKRHSKKRRSGRSLFRRAVWSFLCTLNVIVSLSFLLIGKNYVLPGSFLKDNPWPKEFGIPMIYYICCAALVPLAVFRLYQQLIGPWNRKPNVYITVIGLCAVYCHIRWTPLTYAEVVAYRWFATSGAGLFLTALAW